MMDMDIVMLWRAARCTGKTTVEHESARVFDATVQRVLIDCDVRSRTSSLPYRDC